MAVRNADAQPDDAADFPPSGRGESTSGPYRDAIEIMPADGAEYPQIWHMFAFRPGATKRLARFTQQIMRVTAPLSPGIRELIAAFTSYRNNCPF